MSARQERIARKARQRAGEEHYYKPPKVGTPVALRAKNNALVWVSGYGWRIPSSAGSSTEAPRFTLGSSIKRHLFRKRGA